MTRAGGRRTNGQERRRACHVVGVTGLAGSVAMRRSGRAVRALPPAAYRDVGLHQLANIGLGEELVAAQRVLDAGGGQELPGPLGGEIGGTVGLLADLAQAARQLGGGAERGHPVALDQPGDGRVVDPRLQRQLTLAHLLFLQLASQPAVERPRRLKRHAPSSCAVAHR